MRSAWVGKLLLVLVVIGVLQAVLWRIGFLVDERRGRQVEAVQSVQQSLASSQTVAGPLLQRRCTEEWTQSVGTGQDRHDEPARRDFVLVATAQDLVVDGVTQSDTRHRGLFKVNGYNAQLSLEAHWASLDALRPRRELHHLIVHQIHPAGVAKARHIDGAKGQRAHRRRQVGRGLHRLTGGGESGHKDTGGPQDAARRRARLPGRAGHASRPRGRA